MRKYVVLFASIVISLIVLSSAASLETSLPIYDDVYSSRCNADIECPQTYGEKFVCRENFCVLEEIKEEIEPFADELIGCSGPIFAGIEMQRGKDIRASKDAHPTGQRQSALRTAVKTRARVDKHLNNVSQRERPQWGNSSCFPASGASILEYWNRTYPGILGGRNLTEVVEHLRNLSKTTENGTPLWNFTLGMTKFLNETGYSENFTFKGFVSDFTKNDSTVLGSRVIRGLNVTYTVDNDINFTELVREASTETVILILSIPGFGQHAVALSDYNTNPTPNGAYSISIMDPWEGHIINVLLDDSFGTTIIMPDGTSVGLIHMFSLSPV